MNTQQLPFFRLYGLVGCPHCDQAGQFLQSRQVPFLMTIANDDPIAIAGVKEITKQENFPVLCCTFNKEILVGFKQEDYDRLAKLYHQLAGAGAFGGSSSTSNVLSGGQSVESAASNPTQVVPGRDS